MNESEELFVIGYDPVSISIEITHQHTNGNTKATIDYRDAQKAAKLFPSNKSDYGRNFFQEVS